MTLHISYLQNIKCLAQKLRKGYITQSVLFQ